MRPELDSYPTKLAQPVHHLALDGIPGGRGTSRPSAWKRQMTVVTNLIPQPPGGDGGQIDRVGAPSGSGQPTGSRAVTDRDLEMNAKRRPGGASQSTDMPTEPHPNAVLLRRRMPILAAGSRQPGQRAHWRSAERYEKTRAK